MKRIIKTFLCIAVLLLFCILALPLCCNADPIVPSLNVSHTFVCDNGDRGDCYIQISFDHGGIPYRLYGLLSDDDNDGLFSCSNCGWEFTYQDDTHAFNDQIIGLGEGNFIYGSLDFHPVIDIVEARTGIDIDLDGDGIPFSATPEPSSLFLLLSGVSLVAGSFLAKKR